MYGLWIDTKTGKRFVNELADRKIRADAIIRVGNKCIAMTDAYGFSIGQKLIAESLPVLMERGVVKKIRNPRRDGGGLQLPDRATEETIEKFNKGVAAGKDEVGPVSAEKPEAPGPRPGTRSG